MKKNKRELMNDNVIRVPARSLKEQFSRPHRLGSRLWCPVIKFGSPGRLMRSQLLGMLEAASILQVNRYTGSTPGVTPDRCQKPRVARSFPDRCPGIVPVQRAPAKRGASLIYLRSETAAVCPQY